MTELSREQIQEFLCDLDAISRKHGVVIHGCGCCCSPFMLPMDQKTENEACYMAWDRGTEITWQTKKRIDETIRFNKRPGSEDNSLIIFRSDGQ